MLIINWSGLKKTHFIPKFSYQRSEALWYIDVRFLFLQATLYSVGMSNGIIEVLHDASRENL